MRLILKQFDSSDIHLVFVIIVNEEQEDEFAEKLREKYSREGKFSVLL